MSECCGNIPYFIKIRNRIINVQNIEHVSKRNDGSASIYYSNNRYMEYESYDEIIEKLRSVSVYIELGD